MGEILISSNICVLILFIMYVKNVKKNIYIYIYIYNYYYYKNNNNI